MKRKKIKITRTELFVFNGKVKNENRLSGTTDTNPTTTVTSTTTTGFVR